MANSKQLRTLAADRAAGLSSVPADALLLDAGPFTLAAGDEPNGKLKVNMRARSGQALNHWYWGRVVHDMTGFSPAAETIPIDYCHFPEEVLGFLNTFAAKNEGLDVAGELVSFQADDRSAEVTHKARAGVPYQASIYFQPHALEEVLAGAEVEVNGYKLAGPALVIRKWTLRGVAVCPYGYDPQTSTKLSAGQLADVPVHFLSSQLEPEMSQQPKPENTKQDEQKPAAELTASAKPTDNPPADPRAEFQATLAKFAAKFGDVNGAKWAAEGLSYEAALERHVEFVTSQLTATAAELTKSNEKLAAVPRGEDNPVSFNDADGKGAQAKGVGELKNHIGENLARFAAGITMPGKK